MARVLFALQAIAWLLIAPVVPGFPRPLRAAGLVLMVLAAGLPVLSALSTWSPREVLAAFWDAFSYRRLGIRS